MVRSSALSHEEQYYALQMTRYHDARAEDMRRRLIALERSRAWAIARNKAAVRGPLNLPFNPASPDMEGCRSVVSSDHFRQ